LRLNTAGAYTVTQSGTLTIATGGILETGTVGNNAATITGGTLQAGAGADLVVNQFDTTGTSSTLTIASAIADNTGTALTKTGGGTLILSNPSNTFAGAVNLNQGTLQFAAAGSLGVGSALNFNGGTLQYGTGLISDISSRTITFGAAGGTIDTNSNNETFLNVIGNNGSGGFTKAGAAH